MKNLSIFVFLSLLLCVIPADGQCKLKLISTRELSVQADIIACVRVKKTTKAHNPMYQQLATLEITNLIKGDPKLKEIKVWAMNKSYCSEDVYKKNDQMLVFLRTSQVFYKTLNSQHGQFKLQSTENGLIVEKWRPTSADTKSPEDPQEKDEKYDTVTEDITDYLDLASPPTDLTNEELDKDTN